MVTLTYKRPWMYPLQEQAFFCKERYSIVEASTKAGKAQPLDALIYTPTGPILMGDIAVGDTVLSPDGMSMVEGIYPQGDQDIYRVTFSDGSRTECTQDHLWQVHAVAADDRRSFQARLRANPLMRRRKDLCGWPRVLPLKEIMTYSQQSLQRMWIPVTQPVHYVPQPVPLDPYLLGVLLGDGGLSNQEAVRLSSIDGFILNAVTATLPAHHKLTKVAGDNCDYAISLTRPYQSIPATQRIIPMLRSLGLMGLHSYRKHIPDIYRYNSLDVRLQIIRGLMDTDGWVDKKGQPHFDQTSPQLAKDVSEIIESLGGITKTTYTHNAHRGCYNTRITIADGGQLFTLLRKVERCSPKIQPMTRTFRSIEKVRRAPAQCIKVSHPDGLYLTDRFIVTHNTTGCIAWLVEQALVADKPGRHYWWIAPVFSQARIAYRRIKLGLPKTIMTSNETELTITLANGAIIDFKGADNPDSLFGQDVFAAVLDEASRMKEEAWHAVRSTLTATQGPVRIIGNVKGRRNWAYDIARRAESGEPNMRYTKITAYDAVAAGVLDDKEILDAQRTLPENVFKELYLAEPSDDSGNPFGMEAIHGCIAPLSLNPPVCWGWDLARAVDFTVGIALDKNGAVCRFERWQAPWEVTIARIHENTAGLPALVDSTGVGDPPLESLQKLYASLLIKPLHGGYEGFKFHMTSKQQLMELLSVAIHQKTVHFPAGQIVNELLTFEYEYTRRGVKYSCPRSLHDDCVMSLALALMHFQHAKPVIAMRYAVAGSRPFDNYVPLSSLPNARFVAN